MPFFTPTGFSNPNLLLLQRFPAPADFVPMYEKLNGESMPVMEQRLKRVQHDGEVSSIPIPVNFFGASLYSSDVFQFVKQMGSRSF